MMRSAWKWALGAMVIVSATGCGEDDISATSADPGEVAYEDMVVGTGAELQDTSTFTVHYIGYLDDGRVFDTTLDNGVPFVGNFAQVIPGWRQGMVGTGADTIPPMRIGGSRKLTIPPGLGYGFSPPAGSIIPPNATLIFEIDLIDAEPSLP